ncbi:glycosyltransferase family 2 protein [Arachidicoccus soli]|uniref:Glycosyltransferase family 2 protein n=1 Tax=Arachidicoccus soli TaxID=2341117 RepID=A0A386HSR9_9BACT|nr:glycosyltransferase [Arachidicoccus soli]AYD48853.1 glycosyltransferase family 2 protein [Arachidicoccus soli]
MSWQSLFLSAFQYGLLIYSTLLLLFYVFIGIYSTKEIRHYILANQLSNDRDIVISSIVPGISVIAPAYNESQTVIDNVRSLLSVHYERLELIIVNDGSKDDSLEKLIAAYDLKKIPFYFNERIKTKPIRGIYKSSNPVFNKLIVVDKANGGKADALNAGINISSNPLIACIDVDCVMEQNALIKIVKPFLDTTTKRIICSGGVIRIANSCIIEDGRLIEINLPDQFLPRMQTLEYIRSFLLGRMAWSRLNGLLIISGAFGVFDKGIVIKAGGYDTRTVGEDMELVVRMRRYLEEQKINDYKVTYIPDPLCWTEGPSNYKILSRQRSRWTRGLVETLYAHRRMFFNPNYNLLGMLSYPFWFFYEFLAPIVETIGMFIFLIFCMLHMVRWSFFFQLLIFILSFGLLYSIFAILMEVLTYNQYKKKKNILSLVKTALLEPFVFHPYIVLSAINGLVGIYKQKKEWGDMARKGFQQKDSEVKLKK